MSVSEMKKYGKIGTDEITIASPIFAKIALLPNGYTEMHEEKPDEPGCWVINDTGGWDMTIDRNMISEKRKQAPKGYKGTPSGTCLQTAVKHRRAARRVQCADRAEAPGSLHQRADRKLMRQPFLHSVLPLVEGRAPPAPQAAL